ncbi:hypothetical protein RHSIM_Rhsim13G0176800 [Rhododendron simsii]|uniref:Defensin-like protein n=1 Tax=Rhododendron simsii TaxID=118357 RepID=A0A834FXT1_RHOSS|nr:hypothetical protein RHSIM_Rhsim13G0176800 [Rhododendron simsii]
MIPQQWAPPCGNECTHKYAALMQIPWLGRVFCKKGCDSDVETLEDCVGECEEICYKDPVLKDRQWSAYIDRSPGAAGYSEDCFRACVAGCGYKDIIWLQFEIPSQKVDTIHPNRPVKPPPVKKLPPPPPFDSSKTTVDSSTSTEDILSASA